MTVAVAPAALTTALVRADTPAAREKLLGLEAWARAALAAHHAGCTRVTVLVPAGGRSHFEAALRDARFAKATVELIEAAPEPLAIDIPAGVVVNTDAVRALRAGEAAPPSKGVWLAPELSRAARKNALLRSLANPCDGIVDTWVNRPLSRVLTTLLVPTGISPNAVTVLSCLIALAGVGCIATGEWRLGVAGALLFQLGAAVDCVDGEIARLTYRFSPLGARLDLALDNVAHVALFAAMAWVARLALGDQLALLVGIAAVIGCAGSFALVYRLSFHPPDRAPSSKVRAMLDRITNRDFSLLVIAAAALGWWHWLLVLIAAGTWAFGALLFLTALRDRTPPAG